MKKTLLALILFLSAFLTTLARADEFMPGWTLAVAIPCNVIDEGPAGMMVPGDTQLCNCNGMNFLNNGAYYCTPGWGLWPNNGTFPENNPENCPDRVNRQWPAVDGVCGNKLTGSEWVLQRFGQVNLQDWGCTGHDICYVNCKASRWDCDQAIWQSINNGCETYYPFAFDWVRLMWRTNCFRLAAAYFGTIRVWGEESYRVSQIDACQCGPDNSRSDGCNGGQIVCLYWGQPGCPGGPQVPLNPNPVWPPYPILPPFPGPGIDF